MGGGKKNLDFQPKKTTLGDDGDGTWDDKARQGVRQARIQSRKPTGHPGLVKKVEAARQELERAYDERESDYENQPPGHGSAYSSDEVEMAPPPPTAGKRRKQRVIPATDDYSDEVEIAPPKPEKSSSRSAVRMVGEIERSGEKKKKSSSKSGHRETGREPISDKEGNLATYTKSKKKPKVIEYESEGDVEPEVIVKPVKVKKHKSRSKTSDEVVQVGNATFLPDGDATWSQPDRHEQRYDRIANRKPTGHPALAARVQAEMNNIQDDSEDEAEVYASSEEEVEVFNPHHSKHRSSTRQTKTTSAAAAAPKKPTSKKSASLKFGEAKTIDDDEEDEEWADRHEERFTRIRKRVPTGHPGLAQKMAQIRAQIEEEDPQDSDSEEVVVEKKKKSSKSSSSKVSSKKIRA